MSKPKIKENLKNLLNEISFKTPEKRQEWFEIIEYMNIKELNEAYNHFKSRKEKEEEIKLKIIVKYGLEDVYTKGIDKLSQIFVNKAKEKENKK